MHPIKTLLIEDNHEQQQTMQVLLDNFHPEIDLQGIADGVSTGYQLIKKTNPELVFMDIEILEGNAFHILEKLKQEKALNFKIIFITAFRETDYMAKAIDYAALSYLPKPIDRKELAETIKKATKEVIYLRQFSPTYKKQLYEDLGQLFDWVKQVQKPIKIGVRFNHKTVFLLIEDILYLQSDGQVTYFFTKKKGKFIGNKHLKKYGDILENDHSFLKIHNRYIINPTHITHLNHKAKTVTLNEEITLPVATRRTDQLKLINQQASTIALPPAEMKTSFFEKISRLFR